MYIVMVFLSCLFIQTPELLAVLIIFMFFKVMNSIGHMSSGMVTWYALQGTWNGDIQSCHVLSKEGNGKTPYSLICSGSLFNRI